MIDCGIDGFSDALTDLEVHGGHSGSVEIMPRFRKCNFIPYWARRKRFKMLAHMEYFLTRLKAETKHRARLWTATGGERLPIDGVGERTTEMLERIRRLQSRKWFKNYYNIVFRGVEFGQLFNTATDKLGNKLTITNTHGTFAPGAPFKDEHGNWLFHPHVHLIVVQKKYISNSGAFYSDPETDALAAEYKSHHDKLIGPRLPSDWFKMLTRVRKELGGFTFDEGGEIINIREACKYPVKPFDSLALDNDTFRKLYHTLYKRRLMTPLGKLREQIRWCLDNGKKVERPKKANGFQFQLVPDPNSHLKGDAELLDEENGELKEQIRRRDEKEQKEEDGEKTNPFDWSLVALIEAGPRGTPLREVGFLIRKPCGMTVTRDMLMHHPRIRKIVEATREPWNAGVLLAGMSGLGIGRKAKIRRIAPISLDTSPVTVQPRLDGLDEKPGPEPPPGLESVPDRQLGQQNSEILEPIASE
jgi:hypothetical protein